MASQDPALNQFTKHLLHHWNNFIGLIFGKCELITLFPRPEYLQKLTDHEIDLLFKLLAFFRELSQSTQPEILLEKVIRDFQIERGEFRTLVEFFENKEKVGEKLLSALSSSPSLKKEFSEVFLGLVSADQIRTSVIENLWKTEKNAQALHAFINELIQKKNRLEAKLYSK